MHETERLFPFWVNDPPSLRYIAARMFDNPTAWLVRVNSPIEVDVYATNGVVEDMKIAERVMRAATLPMIEQRAREIAAAKRARERDT